MKVILSETIQGVGEIGEVISVKDGYYRNFLEPKHLAKAATKGNLKTLEQEKDLINKKRAEQREKFKSISERIDGKEFAFYNKAGKEGKLFGTVTPKEIAELIEKEFGIKMDKKKIHLPEHIKFVGEYDILIDFSKEIKPKIKIIVKDENDKKEDEKNGIEEKGIE
ncbi:MAG: 50S ribosomal protein L9 [Clostridiales Family XIII bacterium]|nr:50S ribosomal protein L9 [Clostridiales Family XIII bacterium]